MSCVLYRVGEACIERTSSATSKNQICTKPLHRGKPPKNSNLTRRQPVLTSVIGSETGTCLGFVVKHSPTRISRRLLTTLHSFVNFSSRCPVEAALHQCPTMYLDLG